MSNLRRTGHMFGVGLALGTAAFYLMLIFSDIGILGTSNTNPTRLEVKLNQMSEIHQALATPIPPPDPLSPITEKPAHALVRTAVPLEKVKQRRQQPMPALSKAAREARAAMEPAPEPVGSYLSPAFDRHAVR